MILLMLKFAIAGLVFSTGLSASREDLTWIWQRPVLLVRSFAAMYLLVPLAAVMIIVVFDPPPGARAALLFLSISAGAPLLPKKLIKLGDDPAFAFSLVVATSLMAIVTVPLSLIVLAPWLPADAAVVPSQVAATILKSFLLPLAAGMLVRRFWPGAAERLGDPLMRVAGAGLAIGAIAVIAGSWEALTNMGVSTFLAFGGFTLAALGIGHWMGSPDHQASLAVACATRHIGSALLVAANVRGPNTLALVAAYLLASAVVSVPYVRWSRKRQTGQ